MSVRERIRTKKPYTKQGTKNNRYSDDSVPPKAKQPSDEKKSKLALGLMAAGLKDLPYPKNNTRAYQFAADPFAEPLVQAMPYALYNRMNKMIAARYGGNDNLDGGSAQSYTTAIDSTFLSCPDFMRTKIVSNYNGLRTKPIASGELRTTSFLIDEQRRVIAEALGTLLTTTFTDLGINDYVVVTDMPMGDAIPATTSQIAALGLKNPDGTDYTVPTGCQVYFETTDVIFAVTRFYQQYLQMVNDHIRWSNMFRLKQGEMIRSAYDREAPQLNFLFSNMNKSALLNALEGLAMGLKGEFFDTRHAMTIMTATGTPSRESEAMLSPFIEIQNVTQLPNRFIMFNKTGSTDTTEVHYPVYDLDLDSYMTEDTTSKRRIDKIVEDAMDLLSAESTMTWARTTDFTVAIANTQIANSARARTNSYVYMIQAMTVSFTRFKTMFTDIRQLLENAIPSGLIYWAKGYKPSIVRDTNSAVDRNITLEDMFRCMFSGDNNLIYNAITKRFRASSLWSLYTGIPGYDDKSGGSFITFCFKTLNATSDADMSLRKMPLFFEVPSTQIQPTATAVTRNGITLKITARSVQLSADANANRLTPLASQAAIEFRVPYVTITGENSNTERMQSAALALAKRMLMNLCGMVTDANPANPVEIDPDIIAIYTSEITDITNMMINFARNTSVFRGASDVTTELGFAGI